ncbi:MAG: hypothetical protein GXP45_02710 [bacterium]|nr:hypothetical protein [bacterium]
MMTPFQLGKRQIQIIGSGANQIKASLQDFFHTNIGDLIGFSQQVEIKPVVEEKFGDKIIQKFQKFKVNINNAVQEHSKLSLGICDMLVKKIENLYEHPTFQFAIVLLMFILLFPFVRLAFWIISILAFLIFKILYRLGVYKKQKHLQEVEEIV